MSLNDYDEEEPDPSNDSEDVIRQFAEITDTNEAFAHFILQGVNYDLDRALTKYFSSEQPENEYKKFNDESTSSKNQPPTKLAKFDDELPGEITIVSWNVDGIEEKNLERRFKAVLYIIATVNPEIVFLQEMVEAVMPSLKGLMDAMYNIVVSDSSAPYFCVTLISKNIVIKSNDVIKFENTTMFRSMTCVTCEWQKLKINLINTHLESLRESSVLRVAQLDLCFKMMYSYIESSSSNQTLTVFAGDLNLRDSEMPKLANGVSDAWEAAGKPKNDQYTWDTRRNDNKSAGFARCRFDRLFYTGPYKNVDFNLQGTQRILGPNCFPSDHFAMICKFRSPKA